MTTKTITITEDAYMRLASNKAENESFSEVITKLTKKHSILDLVGILKPIEADELRAAVKDVRTRMRKQMERTASRL
jgi:predicted CopG family antitoxin